MSLLDTAHEIWATAQLLPGEGIVDGVGRVESLLSQCRKEALLEAIAIVEANILPRLILSELLRMAESDKTTMEGEKE